MPATATKTHYPHIVQSNDTMSGEPRIDGHRIRVRDVAAMRDVHGHTAEQIAVLDYPQLTPAEVYAALAYFEDHRNEMAEYERCQSEFIERFKAENATIVTDLR